MPTWYGFAFNIDSIVTIFSNNTRPHGGVPASDELVQLRQGRVQAPATLGEHGGRPGRSGAGEQREQLRRLHRLRAAPPQRLHGFLEAQLCRAHRSSQSRWRKHAGYRLLFSVRRAHVVAANSKLQCRAEHKRMFLQQQEG